MYTWLKLITKLANKDKNAIIRGKKSNPITSQRISGSVQYPNGGILLPEHDMFRV